MTFILNEPTVLEHICWPPQTSIRLILSTFLLHRISFLFMPLITLFKNSMINSHERPLYPFPLSPPTWKDHSPVRREPTIIYSVQHDQNFFSWTQSSFRPHSHWIFPFHMPYNFGNLLFQQKDDIIPCPSMLVGWWDCTFYASHDCIFFSSFIGGASYGKWHPHIFNFHYSVIFYSNKKH